VLAGCGTAPGTTGYDGIAGRRYAAAATSVRRPADRGRAFSRQLNDDGGSELQGRAMSSVGVTASSRSR